jgi:4-amino-4-deoxy-L-arabinose transferase-like glycosyltransferase
MIISIYFSIVFQKNKYAFAGGLFAGLGFGFRFSAAFGILPVFIFTFKRNWKSAFSFLLGILTSIGMLIVLAELAGIKLNEFLFYGLTDNFGSGSATNHSLAWKVQRFADGFLF